MDILKKQGKAVSSIFPKRFKFWHYIFLAASILFSLPASNAHSAQVTLAWDASTDSNTAGYKLHYGISSGSYQAVIDVGKTTTCTISNLPDGTTYYFAATDYNASGTESAYSNEVSYTTSATCTYSISPTSQSPGSSGGPGTVSVTASSGCSWTAMSNAPSWIAVTSNGSVTGNGTVNYSVSANSGTTSRTGTITIAGKTFTVTQSGSSQKNGPTAVTLSPSPASPQLPGTNVTWTTAASGGSGSYEYQFLVMNPAGIWTVARAYSSTPTWIWNTTGLAIGTYYVQVWARSVGSANAYDVYNGAYYRLGTTVPPATAVTLSPSPASPQSPGTNVTWTAAASGGSGSYEYQFLVMNPAGIWTVARAYSSTPTWIWNTTGLATGTYYVQVWARSVGSANAYDVYNGANYRLQ